MSFLRWYSALLPSMNVLSHEYTYDIFRVKIKSDIGIFFYSSQVQGSWDNSTRIKFLEG
jgi:hypothetical protein